jgi:very-short-patch-repair endonuclease
MNKIEQMFYDALLAVFRNHMNNEDYKDGMDAMEYLSLFEPGEIGNIETLNYQVPMGIYIVDFLIVSTEGQEFVIEIDGHEFHKTKEQRFKDYQRERFLQEQGKIVFRFMASEVYTNAYKCALWTVDTISEYSEKLSNQIIDAYEAGSRNKK